MKASDIVLVALAAVGIYYIGKRFMNDAKKPVSNVSTEPSIAPATNQIITEPPPKSITMIGTPSINGTDIDVVKWVEND